MVFAGTGAVVGMLLPDTGAVREDVIDGTMKRVVEDGTEEFVNRGNWPRVHSAGAIVLSYTMLKELLNIG